MKRFFRDTGILLAFCGAFYVLILMVGGLDGDSNTDASEFSPLRIRADRFEDKNDWGSAIIEFEKLTEVDPYNGYAWNRLGSLLLKTKRDAIGQWDELDSNQRESTAAIEISKRIEETTNRTAGVFDELSKFARYRPYALLQLAVLECDRNNHDEALDKLEEFVARGYTTGNGLSNALAFGVGPENAVWVATRVPENVRLHQYRRFWSLVRRENERRSEFDFHSSTPSQQLRFNGASWGNAFPARR